MVSDLEDLDAMRDCCEQQELLSENGVIPPDAYKQLLLIYLINNDVVNAKFLWKRVPDVIKTDNNELQAIWKIGQYLWKRDFPNVYVTAQGEEWSNIAQPLIDKLVANLRERMMRLVIQAYSVIKVVDLGKLLGLNEVKVMELVATELWDIDNENKLIKPRKKEDKEVCDIDQSETFDQLMNSLTDYVTFLEN